MNAETAATPVAVNWPHAEEPDAPSKESYLRWNPYQQDPYHPDPYAPR